MGKAPDAFRTISEVAEWLDVAPHVLRFWESKFAQVKPVKRAGGRRYYRPTDMRLLGGIKVLLHDEGHTIKAVQSLIREEGVASVAARAPMIDSGEDVIDLAPETPAPEVEPAEVETNVVAFEPAEAEETETPVAEPDSAPAEHEEPEPVAATATDTAKAADAEPAPAPRVIEIPEIEEDTPDYDALALSALGLSLQADKTVLAANAARIAPILERLQALRAQMASHGSR